MKRSNPLIVAAFFVFVALFWANITLAAEFNPTNTKELIDALKTAQAEAGPHTIHLVADQTYSITNAYHVDEKEGLPQITKDVTINGNNATIERSSDDIFTILVVSGSGTLTINDTTLLNGGRPEGDDTLLCGGGILNFGSVLIKGSTIRNCNATDGGAICNKNSMTAMDTAFESNSSDASGYGGAIVTNSSTSTTFVRCILANNTSGDGGGGIASFGTMNLSNSTFINNSARNGGAVFMQTSEDNTIDSSAFMMNAGTDNGGGAIFKISGILRIANSTFSKNIGRFGGAIRNEGGQTTITHSTFSKNMAEIHGGALLQNSSDVIVQNSIFAENSAGTSGNDYYGTVVSGGGNIISSSAGSNGFDAELDLLDNEDIHLDTFIDSTEAGKSYYPLFTDSSAVNFGIGDHCIETDQIGNSRASSCSSGAIEPQCGDNIVHALLGEECDAGNGNSDTEADACRTTCKNPYCGDGVIDTGEECDGGGSCSNMCTVIVEDDPSNPEPTDNPTGNPTPAEQPITEEEATGTAPQVENAAQETGTTETSGTTTGTASAAKPSGGCSLIR